jgi:curved DNA-binding protein CbpA
MADLRFRLINEAYATLKTKDKRERYNRQLRNQIKETRKITQQARNDNKSPRKQKGFFGALFSDLFTPAPSPAESREGR